MLTKWILLGLIGVIFIGWLLDHTALTNQLNNTRNRPLTRFNLLQLHDCENYLLHELPDYQVVYKTLKSWQFWKETNDKRYVEFASTALNILDCSTVQEFREHHLVISKHVRVGIETKEAGSFDRFIELALNDGN